MNLIEKMKDKELINEFESACQMIEDIGCYGTKDLIYRDLLEQEINNRNMEICRITKVKQSKG